MTVCSRLVRERTRRAAPIAAPAILLIISTASSGDISFAEAANRMPLEVLEPLERAVLEKVPVSVGVVFPPGTLKAPESGRVVDDLGNILPLDVEVAGWWEPERRTVKWLLLKFSVTTRT
jgi:hypothetical protein